MVRHSMFAAGSAVTCCPAGQVALRAASRRNPLHPSTPNRPICRSSQFDSCSSRRCTAALGCGNLGSSRSPRNSPRGSCPSSPLWETSARRNSSTTADWVLPPHERKPRQHPSSLLRSHREACQLRPSGPISQVAATPCANTAGTVSNPRIVHRCDRLSSMCAEPWAHRTCRRSRQPHHCQTS